MDTSVLFESVWTSTLAFVATLVGCLLATQCLARIVGTGTLLRRAGWLLLGSWAIITAAVWDTFFIATTDLRTEGLQVRYVLVPIIVTIVTAVLATTAALVVIMSSMKTARVVWGGMVLGLAVAVSSFQAIRAIRTNRPIAFHVGILIAACVFAMVATPVPLAIALRSQWRGALTAAAIVLALVVTVTQYVNLYSIDFGQPVVAATMGGVLPATVIIPVALAFVARLVLLLLVMLAGTGPTSRLSATSSRPKAAPRR